MAYAITQYQVPPPLRTSKSASEYSLLEVRSLDGVEAMSGLGSDESMRHSSEVKVSIVWCGDILMVCAVTSAWRTAKGWARRRGIGV